MILNHKARSHLNIITSFVLTYLPYILRFVVTAYSDLAIRLGRNEDQVQGGINLLWSRATRYTVR